MTDSSVTRPGLWQLFVAFNQVGLSGFGGVLPFVRRSLVERHGWISPEEFNTLLGLCQFLPGPNVINLSVVVGARFHGALGALTCAVGLLAAPMVIVLLLGVAYDHYGSLPVAQSMLRGIACVGAGLIFATGVRMGMAVKEKAVFLPFAALVFVAVGLLRWPMPLVMVLLALVTSWLAWARARQAKAKREG